MARATSTGNKLSHQNSSSAGAANKQHGIFVGKVKENVDPKGLGRLQVWIPQLSAVGESDRTGWFTVRYCPPMAGAGDDAGEAKANDATKYKQTNQSYGVWMVPPDKNVQVICGFLNGDIHQGIWWACLPHDGHTHSLPGIASGSTHEGAVLPVAERNRYNNADPQNENRPEHIVSNVIKGQGLERDRQRGHTNAGPFRNAAQHPGKAYGVLTPGQHQFVMDDGPDGHSGQIRLRTQSGNSIIMDNNCGFIYVINANGSAWLQLDKKGNIDFYAAGDFSVNAEGSINLRASENINLDAGVNINAGAVKNFNLEACEIFNATGTNGMRLSTSQNMNIYADSQVKVTGQRIDLNGPIADRATLPTPNALITNSAIGKSIAGRVPEAEPYGGHDCRNEGEQPTTAPGSPGVPDSVITPAPESYEDKPAPTETNAIDCVPEPTQSRLSDDGFKILKSREAYRGMMYSDVQGQSIGYGIRLDIFGPNGGGKIDQELKQALAAGPSEAEARLASRQIIDRENTPRVMRSIEKAKAGKNACLTQSQIDALIMASYGSPVNADKMAQALVDAAAAQPDGKATNEDIAKIWANTPYNNDSKIRNSDAKYAMTGKPNPDTVVKEPEKLRDEGTSVDQRNFKSNKCQLPADTSAWKTPYGNGGAWAASTGNAYGPPSTVHQAQFERSQYLNTGNVPYGSRLTVQQLRDKYGAPHLGGNFPPGANTKVSGNASDSNVG